jgi:hypothetical protein
MKYIKQSTVLPNAFDSYEISGMNIDIASKTINVSFLYIAHTDSGVPVVENIPIRVSNVAEYRVKEDWEDKPEGFDINDKLTWKNYTWETIPKEPVPEKQYATNIIKTIDTTNISIKEIIYLKFAELGLLPSDGWSVYCGENV